MKKLATFVFAMLLSGSLAFAQTAAPSPSPEAGTTKTTKHKKAKKAKKSKKGSSTAEPTATPK